MRISSNRCHFCFNGWSNVYIGQNFEISVFYNSQDKKWKQWIWSTLDLYANLRNIHRMTFTKLSTKNIMTLQFHLHDICRLLILYVIERYAKLLDNEDSLIAWVIRRTIVADGTLNITWGRVPKWKYKILRKSDVRENFLWSQFLSFHYWTCSKFIYVCGLSGDLFVSWFWCVCYLFWVFFFCFCLGFLGCFCLFHCCLVFFLPCLGLSFLSKVFLVLAKHSQACFQ